MQLAAVDIGSNAIRLQVVRSIKEDELVSFKKTEYLRFPLRLGNDVFTKGRIGTKTEKRFIDLMKAFKILIDLYEVDGHIAVATSAMREAANGLDIIEAVMLQTGLKIEIIGGTEEAEILSKAIIPTIGNGVYTHIDVGGGSTELNVYLEKERIASKSFNMGSVRKLSVEQRAQNFSIIKDWWQSLHIGTEAKVFAIGTGGNINKLYSIANIKGNNSVSIHEMDAVRAYLAAYSIEQRVSILKMNPDRADVIMPASEIYIKVMKMIGSQQMLVPGVGLKDGLIYNLYEKISGQAISQIQFLDQMYMEH